MTWFKVDDSFHSHPKAMAASLAALGLWAVAGSWSGKHNQDGAIPDHVVRGLSRGEDGLADELVAAGLWRRTKGGYRFHEWAADSDGTPRNPTRSEAIAAKANQSSGGAIGNHRRWHTARGKIDPNCRFCQAPSGPIGTDRTRSHPISQPDDQSLENRSGSHHSQGSQVPVGSESESLYAHSELHEHLSGTRSDTDQSPDTPPESHPNPPTRPDTGTTNNTPPSGSPPRKRATRIPDDFAVTAEMVAWARKRVPHVDGRHETEKFVNHWRAKAGRDATKHDWPATWRNWMLNAAERAPRPAGGGGGSRRLDKAMGFLAPDDPLRSQLPGNQPPLTIIEGGQTA